MNEEITTIEDRLINFFQELVSAFPPGCATLRVERAPEVQHDGISVWLTPSVPTAARIVVDAENGNSTVTLCVGHHILIEVLPTKDETIIEGVKEVCLAVISGKVEEDVWTVETEVTKSLGKIEWGGRVHVFRYYGGIYPFRKKTQTHFTYSPYYLPCDGSVNLRASE